MKLILLLSSWLLWLSLSAQDTTRVLVDLNQLATKTVAVKVYPPTEQKEWEYVIPEIVPGTYMKINYVRFYSKVKAFDKDGNKLKVRRKKNVFQISGGKVLDHLTYTVEPSLGDGKIWDNTLVCGGSAYDSSSALINFQMLNGYFEGYEKQPFEIEVYKTEDLYGASSIEKIALNPTTDILRTENYAELIDQPILYAPADTTSFRIKDNTFRIAVYAGAGNITAELLKPRFELLMHEIDSFSGFTTDRDYHFLMYYADKEKLKGLFKTFGTGSALEHKHSSVYYEVDRIRDSTFTNYNWIVPHEYFHTITPLSLHSEKIADFNFRKADMSRHVWMYEGITDYFALLMNAQSDTLIRSGAWDMAFATQSSINRKKQSMTESGRNIIRKRNIVSWVRKVIDIMNFYEKGKLIAFAMDMELIERSGGERRLLDVILDMEKDYADRAFDDTQLLEILEQYTYPGFKAEFAPYIEGTELPPYEEYYEKLGWKFLPGNSKVPTYGQFHWRRNKETDQTYVSWLRKKNQLGFEKGDTILEVNSLPIDEFFDKEEFNYYRKVIYPEEDAELKVKVIRAGDTLNLSGRAKAKKISYAKMKLLLPYSEEQKEFRKVFYKREESKKEEG